MNVTKLFDNHHVFLRACEGLPVLLLVVTFLALGWILRREPLF